MTRLHNSDINLKSSVYNLTGENYFEQLSAYNSMRFHIRRVLLAKSVVDARNKKYINNKKKELKRQLPRRFSLDNFIDQLAFDTKHHPMDMLRMNLDKYSSRRSEENNCETYLYDINDIDYSQLVMQATDTESNNKDNYQNRLMLKSKKIVSDMSESQFKTAGKKHIKGLNSKKRIIQGKCRCNEKPIYNTCGKPFDESPTNPYHSDSGSSSSSIIQEDHASSSLSSPVQMHTRKYAEIEAKEDARYVKFAYDITKDIIKYGIYTDKELNEIFKKHLQQHRTTLDLNKMLKEIYRLKTFLNMSEESDISDDDMEFLNTDQIQLHEVRPPTPPKILDENKVIGKLLSYQKLMETQCNKEARSKKAVILIDANPELFITERDVLTSLLEVGIDPKQVENICKSLHRKSMETVLDNMVDLKINTIPNKLETLPADESETFPDKLKNVELRKETTIYPENTFLENLKSRSKNQILKNENKSSTTNDLSSKQDETIQTQRSPVILRNDNYTEPMCSTFSQLYQENLPLNIADEVIQTEIQISVGSRIRMNKLGVQDIEVYEEKKKCINENMEVPSIAPTDILAWSRDKIAKIKAHTSNVIEKPAGKSDYTHRIPISKSTQKFLSLQKRKKSPNDSRVTNKAKSTTQRKKLKKEKIPKRSGSSRIVDNKPIKNISIKPKKGILQKKDRESKKLVAIPRKTKTFSAFEATEKINKPIQNESASVLNTCCGISITRLNMDKRKPPKYITQINITGRNDTMIQQESKEGQNEIEIDVSKLNGYESTINKETETSLSETDKNDKEKIIT